MKTFKHVLAKAAIIFGLMTLICGLLYTLLITGIAQLFFRDSANGSIIEIDGVKYGSEMLAQNFTGEEYMWGRVMNIDVSTYTDEDGNILMYASPSNLSPESEEFEEIVQERIEEIREANPDMAEEAIPADLVTCSGSGLDPDISPEAAEFQVARIAEARGISEDEVREVIDACTTGRLFGIFGEPTVNVLEVNLILDGILDIEDAY